MQYKHSKNKQNLFKIITEANCHQLSINNNNIESSVILKTSTTPRKKFEKTDNNSYNTSEYLPELKTYTSRKNSSKFSKKRTYYIFDDIKTPQSSYPKSEVSTFNLTLSLNKLLDDVCLPSNQIKKNNSNIETNSLPLHKIFAPSLAHKFKEPKESISTSSNRFLTITESKPARQLFTCKPSNRKSYLQLLRDEVNYSNDYKLIKSNKDNLGKSFSTLNNLETINISSAETTLNTKLISQRNRYQFKLEIKEIDKYAPKKSIQIDNLSRNILISNKEKTPKKLHEYPPVKRASAGKMLLNNKIISDQNVNDHKFTPQSDLSEESILEDYHYDLALGEAVENMNQRMELLPVHKFSNLNFPNNPLIYPPILDSITTENFSPIKKKYTAHDVYWSNIRRNLVHTLNYFKQLKLTVLEVYS